METAPQRSNAFAAGSTTGAPIQFTVSVATKICAAHEHEDGKERERLCRRRNGGRMLVRYTWHAERIQSLPVAEIVCGKKFNSSFSHQIANQRSDVLLDQHLHLGSVRSYDPFKISDILTPFQRLIDRGRLFRLIVRVTVTEIAHSPFIAVSNFGCTTQIRPGPTLKMRFIREIAHISRLAASSGLQVPWKHSIISMCIAFLLVSRNEHCSHFHLRTI